MGLHGINPAREKITVPIVRVPIQLLAPVITLLTPIRGIGMEDDSIRRKGGGSFGFAASGLKQPPDWTLREALRNSLRPRTARYSNRLLTGFFWAPDY